MAQFDFKDLNKDAYFVSIAGGFDTSMKIQPIKPMDNKLADGQPVVACMDKDCPDAYKFSGDDSKIKRITPGLDYEVIFCPK